MIHNIYRPQCSRSFISDLSQVYGFPDLFSAPPDASDMLSLLHHALLDSSADHILLEDNNLHYPQWGRHQANTDTLAEYFSSFYTTHSLDLLLPQSTSTQSDKGHEATIDLVLASFSLKTAMEPCKVRKDLHLGSDHLPNLSVFSFLP